MAPVLEVDVDALNADGGRLESLGTSVPAVKLRTTRF
jgi:hypothetical protein